MLDEREMRGVLGHELMHVYNRDILTSSVAAGIASIIGTIAQILSFGAMFGGSSRDGERSEPPRHVCDCHAGAHCYSGYSDGY